MAITIAAAMPCVAFLACMAIDLSGVSTEHSVFQDAADATALQAAEQLRSGPETALAGRDDQFARSQIGAQAQNTAYSVTTTVSPDGGSVTVQIAGTRPSFFANLLPPGGWQISASATAQALSQTPLCVLVFGDKGGNNLHVQNTSTITAPACLVHSNNDVQVDPKASISAGAVEASGNAPGAGSNISPAVRTDAPVVADPFSSIDLSFPSGCSSTAAPGPGPGNGPGPGAPNTDTYTTATTLPAGLHCNNIDVKDGAAVTLAPGEHYFQGNFTVEDTSTVTGDDVVLVFATNAGFNFTGTSQISLNGRKSGKLAGFVIASSRTNSANFIIQSDHVTNLEGTIYIPASQLQVIGTSPVAQQSNWTVITAMSMQVQQGPPAGPSPPPPGQPPAPPAPPTGPSSPQIVINANYANSSVPRPTGVGDNGSTQVRLTK